MPRTPILTIIVLICLMVIRQEICAQTASETAQPPAGESVAPQPLPEPLPEPLPTREADPGSALLGVRLAPVTAAAVRQYRLAVRRGALITQIEVGSPADQVGLPLGAAIVAVNGQRVDAPGDLVRFIQAARPEQQVELTYYRQDRMFRKSIRLGRSGTSAHRPNRSGAPAALPPAALPGASLEQQLGGRGVRPLLGRLGRAIDQIVTSEGTPTSAANPLRVPDQEVVALRKQVQLLQIQVEQLSRQVAELEKRLPAGR